MAQQLRTLAALAKEQVQFSTPMLLHTASVAPIPENLTMPSGLFRLVAYTWYTHIQSGKHSHVLYAMYNKNKNI